MVGKSKFSTHDIVNVFRSISKLIQNHPEILDNQGVFRLSGSKTSTDQLLNKLIEQKFDWKLLKNYVIDKNKINSDHLHTILGLCNSVLKDCVLLNSSDKRLSGFAKKLNTLLNSDAPVSKKIQESAQLLDAFINKLLLSDSIEHQRAGEILYHYCYFMHTAAAYAISNKMSSGNLAIILAPHFTSELELFTSNDLLALTQFTMEKLTPVLEFYISSNMTSTHFSVRHADKIEHLLETRRKIISKLDDMKAENKRQTVDHMRELMIQTRGLEDQIAQLKIKINDKTLKKDEKKQFKKQLKIFKTDLEELNLEIIIVKDQIEEMIDAHASLLDLSSKLSLSVSNLSNLASIPEGAYLEQAEPSTNSNTTGLVQFGLFGETSSVIMTEEPTDIDDNSLELDMLNYSLGSNTAV